jgi:hypothetical protein
VSYYAWWAYWITVGVWAIVAIGVAVARIHLGPSEPLWVAGLTLPPVVAGLDLVLFRGSHERICAREARDHAWLRALVGRGYSAGTFLVTGVGSVVAGILLAIALLARG